MPSTADDAAALGYPASVLLSVANMPNATFVPTSGDGVLVSENNAEASPTLAITA